MEDPIRAGKPKISGRMVTKIFTDPGKVMDQRNAQTPQLYGGTHSRMQQEEWRGYGASA